MGLTRVPQPTRQASHRFSVVLSCVHPQGNTRAHAGTDKDTRSSGHEHTRAHVQACSSAHRQGSERTPAGAHQLERRVTPAPPPRAHSLGAGAGAPGPRVRILQAARGSRRAASWPLPVPTEGPAGPDEEGAVADPPRWCPAGVPPAQESGSPRKSSTLGGPTGRGRHLHFQSTASTQRQ